jgi:hypothetical protein
MKPIVLYLQKQNLIIGIIVALALVFFLKRSSKALTESFLSLQALSSLCNRKYTPKNTSAGIPKKTKSAPVKPIKPPTPPKQDKAIPLLVKKQKNIKPQCKFGIDINPPSPSVKEALIILTPINSNDVTIVEETLNTIPEFVNIINSPDKLKIIKAIIILNKLLTEPPANISEEEIQHIAITILSDINTVDPQLASLASAHYSSTEATPDTNPFTNLVFPKSEIILNTDAVKTITAEPIRELSPEAIEQITGVLSRIKIFMPYDECTAILTRNI